MSEPLQPGIYLGLDDETYFDDPAVSNSDIKSLLRSPAEYWLRSIHNPARDKKRPTDRMEKGKVFHCLLLEPDKFDKRYFISPGVSWCNVRQMVPRTEYQGTMKAVQVIRSLERAERLFEPRYGYPEVTVVWPDPHTGVMCRAKHDFFCWEWSVDYKTVDSIDEDYIHLTFRRWKYHLQSAHYSNGRKIIRDMIRRGQADFYGDFSEVFKSEFMSGTDDFFIFVFQCKDDPYTAIPVILDDSTLERGMTDVQKGLDLYKRYMEAFGKEKRWPTAPKGVRTFSMFYGFDPTEAL